MKLTEKHFAEFFPRNMRFTHYVAKRYGYRFFNDLAVEKATFLAQKALIKMYQEEREFESNEHMYGIVMSTFRFSILNAFGKNANERNLEIRTESDYIHNDKPDFNFMEYKMGSYTNDFDDTADAMYDLLKKVLNPIEFSVFDLRYRKDYDLNEICNELDLPMNKVRTIRTRIATKYKRITNKIKDKEYEYSNERQDTIKAIQEDKQRVRREIQRRSIESNKEERKRYIETLSWIGLNE